MAIVGAATSFLAGYGLDRHLTAATVVAGAIGGVVGLLFGAVFRRMLLARLHLPIVVWVPISLLLGSFFGGTVGYLTPLVMNDSSIAPILAIFGACAGALQLSWFWLPYAVRAGRGKSTWPVVVAAVVISTVIGHAAVWTTLTILRPTID